MALNEKFIHDTRTGTGYENDMSFPFMECVHLYSNIILIRTGNQDGSYWHESVEVWRLDSTQAWLLFENGTDYGVHAQTEEGVTRIPNAEFETYFNYLRKTYSRIFKQSVANFMATLNHQGE